MTVTSFLPPDRVLIVAEIGNNHEGNYALAEELVERAAEAGVDAVKFQTFRTEGFLDRRDRERFERYKSFELSYNQFEKLAATANRAGLMFFSTPLDLESARFLNTICPVLKIASGDNNFQPLLQLVAGFGKPLLLSCGMSDMDRIAYAKAEIEHVWSLAGTRPELVLLHCTSAYPTPPEEANLGAIASLRKRFHCPIGYSDHTIGPEAVVCAAVLGAGVIEKHFTINKQHSSFRDHQLSADPAEMAEIVRRVRDVGTYLGNGDKQVQPAERPIALAVQRRIVAADDLKQGNPLRWEHLNWVRCTEGLLPGEENRLLGRCALQDIAAGDPLRPEMFD